MGFVQLQNMKMSNNPAKYELLIKQNLRSILDISAFGQHQESRPLGRFTEFSLLCACSESSLTNLIGDEYKTNSLSMLRKSDPLRGRDPWCRPKQEKYLSTCGTKACAVLISCQLTRSSAPTDKTHVVRYALSW